ncbi:hypothetical protein D9M71_725180 [compost metagenome]
MIGAYSGSEKLAAAALARVSCEKIATAWVLAEKQGPRSIPDTLLNSFGATLGNDYEAGTSWVTAAGAAGYPTRREQTLYKPIRQQGVLANCHSLRSGKRT